MIYSISGFPAQDSDRLFKALTDHHFIIAGPCVLESLDLALEVAYAIKAAALDAGLVAVFKSSFDKANRTSSESFRGPGLKKGIRWLEEVRQKTGMPVITDIHEPQEAELVASVVDILQIPALLCRQTALLEAAGKTGNIVNVKKGQFLAPTDMRNVYDKIARTGNPRVLLTERGTTFGYNNLVVDMRSFPLMKKIGVPTVMDATHAVQMPGGQGDCSGGDRAMAPYLARAAAAAGAQGIFMECHPVPDHALCDGPNSVQLSDMPKILKELSAIWRALDA